jgi:hypothetical protein
MILKLHSKPASVGGKRAAEASSHASEAGFGSTAVRPEAAPPEVPAAAPLQASRRAWLATERRQTRMLRKVKEAPEAPAFGRSTARSKQTCVMWTRSEQLERIALCTA